MVNSISNFHLLTFVTKYSRVPEEEIARVRYNAVMEMGAEPIIIDKKGYKLIIDAFILQAEKIGIRILACNIISDHVHIVIDDNGNNIPEIVQKMKGYASYVYNRSFERTGALRAAGYSDTYLDDENHLLNAIQYVRNNHIKHQEKWGNIWDGDDELKSLYTDMRKKFSL